MQAKLPLKSLPEMSNIRKMDSHTNIMETRIIQDPRKIAYCVKARSILDIKVNCSMCIFSSNNGSTIEESLYEFFHPHLKLRNPKKGTSVFLQNPLNSKSILWNERSP